MKQTKSTIESISTQAGLLDENTTQNENAREVNIAMEYKLLYYGIIYDTCTSLRKENVYSLMLHPNKHCLIKYNKIMLKFFTIIVLK